MTLTQLLSILTNPHTVAPWALLTLAVFLVVYLTRRLAPSLWVAFDKITPDGAIGHAIQGLPAVLLGALVGAIAAGTDPGAAWKGALAGAAAPVLHLLLKWAPFVPYAGAVTAIAGRAGVSLLVLLLAGCASLGHWSPDALPDVAALCSLGGDVEPQLEAIAAEYGVPVAFVQAAFAAACSETAGTDPPGARHAGLAAARAGARAARSMRVRFEQGDAGAP